MRIFTLLRNSFLGALLLSVTAVSAQDIHFSQFDQSPLTLNPGLAGTTAWIRATTVYRTQWRAVTDKPYNTMGASFDIKSKKRWIKIKNATSRYRKSDESGFGWGVNFFNDKAGDGKMGTLQANGSLAYQVFLSGKSMLAAGFQGGILQRSVDVNHFQWGSQYNTNTGQYDPSYYPQGDKALTNLNASFIVPDLSTGLVYAYKKSESRMQGNDQLDVIIGASMFHVLSPKYSFLGESERLSQRIVFHGNAVIGINNTNVAIVPGYMISMQGSNREIFAGGMIRYMLQQNSIVTGFVKGAYLYAGGYYRNKDAFVATALLEFSSYGLGVSYDFNVSGLKTVSSGRGGLEITLRFLNPAPFLYSQASFKK